MHPMFIAALFTTAKTCKQPKCPSMDEWKKMWYKYTMAYYLALKKKNEIICKMYVFIEIIILI